VNDKLKQLRNAVVNRGREVEVNPDGSVREVTSADETKQDPEAGRVTKLAPRTFGSGWSR
jgi:hypothetical protein